MTAAVNLYLLSLRPFVIHRSNPMSAPLPHSSSYLQDLKLSCAVSVCSGMFESEPILCIYTFQVNGVRPELAGVLTSAGAVPNNRSCRHLLNGRPSFEV